MSKLADNYGLSDTGLRLVCKKLHIPWPSRGHWQKLKAGQQVERPPLPDLTPASTTAQATTCTSARRGTRPIEDLIVPATVQRWHPAIDEIRAKLKARADKLMSDTRERDDYLAARRRLRKAGPDFSGFRWAHLAKGLLYKIGKPPASVRLTLTSYKRGLAIANALALETEARGGTVLPEPVSDGFTLRLHAASFSISIRERKEDPVTHGSKADTRAPRLTLTAERYNGVTLRVADDVQPLEAQLPSFLARLERAATATPSKRVLAREEREARERAEARAAADLQMAEIARKQLAAARQVELLKEAGRWHQAEQLRAYVAAVAATRPESAEWQAWALSVANALDPLNAGASTFQQPKR